MQGSVRLVNKTTPASLKGNPEIFINNEWATVCSNMVTLKDMQVICRQLGYTFASAIRNNKTSNSLPNYQLKCSGAEQSVTECPYQRVLDTSSCSDQTLQITCTGNNLFLSYLRKSIRSFLPF